jgi:hypothetical protein
MNLRRRLEMELIDAAVALDTETERMGYKRTVIEDALHERVLRYCAYGLAEPRFTRTVHSAPETSHEAGEWMKQFALTDAAAVFRQIYYAYHGRATEEPRFGMTSDEVEVALGRTHQTISARINQLRDTGWVVDSKARRKTRSGRKAIVWTPSQAALDLVDRVGLPIPTNTERSINAHSSTQPR